MRPAKPIPLSISWNARTDTLTVSGSVRRPTTGYQVSLRLSAGGRPNVVDARLTVIPPSGMSGPAACDYPFSASIKLGKKPSSVMLNNQSYPVP